MPPTEEDRREEARAAARGSRRALLARFGRQPVEVRRFVGPEAHRQRLDHLRVAHLTDLHFGTVTPLSVQREAVRRANEASPDLVVLTGDFVCHSQLHLDALEETLGALEAPAVAVLGNHDYWAGGEDVKRSLERVDIEVLRNAHTVRTIGAERLQLVGLDDAYTGRADREAATKGLRPDLATLGLSHIGEEADGLWARGVPLVLSGHTHAGQITFARLHEISVGRLAGHRYVHGLYGTRRPDGASPPAGAVYVGAGIGASVIPLRVGERGRREVTLFELGWALGEVEEHHEEQDPLPGRRRAPRGRSARAEAFFRTTRALRHRLAGRST